MDKEMMEIMKSLMQEMTNGFEKVNKRLDKIETDVKELKTNQEQTNIRLDKIEIDVKELKEKIDNVYNQTADLTDRQRLFLQAFCKRCRVSADFKDCKDYAFKQIGITTESNKTTFFNRLKNRLKTATNK